MILFRKEIAVKQLFAEFVEDVIVNAGLRVLPLDTRCVGLMIEDSERFRLDFDDAYQYTLCKQ